MLVNVLMSSSFSFIMSISPCRSSAAFAASAASASARAASARAAGAPGSAQYSALHASICAAFAFSASSAAFAADLCAASITANNLGATSAPPLITAPSGAPDALAALLSAVTSGHFASAAAS